MLKNAHRKKKRQGNEDFLPKSSGDDTDNYGERFQRFLDEEAEPGSVSNSQDEFEDDPDLSSSIESCVSSTEKFDQFVTKQIKTDQSADTLELKSSLKSSLRYPVNQEHLRELDREDIVRKLGAPNQGGNRVVIDLGGVVEGMKLKTKKDVIPRRKLFASLKQARVDKNDAYHRAFSSANINLDDDSAHENNMGAWKENREQGLRRLSIFHKVEGIFSSEGGFTVKNFQEYFFYTLLAIAIQLSSGIPNVFWPDSYEDDGSRIEGKIKTCSKSITTHLTNNEVMCDLAQTVQEGAQKFRFLAAFILGGFVLSSVKIWTTRRMRYRSLNGKTRTLLVMLFSLIPTDIEDHQLMYERSVLARWTILGYELSILEARGQMDTEDGRDYLEALNVLRADEWEMMTEGDRMTTVWMWINRKAKRLQMSGYIDNHDLASISQCVTYMRDNGMNLVATLYEDNPLPYVYICAMLVNINLLIQTIADGLQWGIWWNDSNGAIYIQLRMYIAIFMQVAYTIIFARLFDLCSALHNPFGPRDFLDLPHNEIGSQLRKLAKQMAIGELPSTMNKQISVYHDSGKSMVVGDEEDNLQTSLRRMNKRLAGLKKDTSTSLFNTKSTLKELKAASGITSSKSKIRLRKVTNKILLGRALGKKSEPKTFVGLDPISESKSKTISILDTMKTPIRSNTTEIKDTAGKIKNSKSLV